MSQRVKKNEDGTITVKLDYPVDHNGSKLSEVTLRGECTVQDLEAMDMAKGEVGKALRLAAELSGCSMNALRKLRASDFVELSTAVNGIMGNESPGTGATS